ncbi:hypothetical protein DRQ36_05840 [bacterium]|nr:MAG: hypothetical protein DRQ36_05840 [bacterium]
MRLYKRGKTYYVDFTYKGKRIRKAVGRDKKTAELALKDIEVRIAKEEYLGVYGQKRVAFKDFAKEYLDYSKSNKAPKTYRADPTGIRNMLKFFGDRLLSEITPQLIEEYKAKRLETVKPASINRELATLSNMFTKANQWQIVSVNPMKEVGKLKGPPGRIRYLSYDEIERLVNVSAPHLKPIIITALNTGMRKSEILNLRWENVDLERRVIIVRETKNNEIRILPINEPLYGVFKTLPSRNKNEWIFPGKNGKPIGSVKTAFKTALRKSGIKDLRFHDLRHTFASYLVMGGVNLRTVQQLLGHKDIKMTMRYSHLSKEHVKDAVEILTESFPKVGTNMAYG